ncbi:MAG: 30S ribosomal protein S8 [Thermodesulfobacteriota bacterium]
MSMTDPLADMLTRIRNAQQAGHKETLIPSSRLKLEVAGVLKDEGYISGVESIADDKQGLIKVTIKYTEDREAVIKKIKRLSRPGLRKYVGKDNIPKILNGLGVAVLSTSKGVMSDRKARELGVGGELLLAIY